MCCFSVSVEEKKAGQGEGRKDKTGRGRECLPPLM